MDGHNIEQEKLTLVAIAALTIAAKFAEKETKVLGQAFFHWFFFILPANGFPGFLSLGKNLEFRMKKYVFF